MSLPRTLLGLLEPAPSHGYDLKHAYDEHFGRDKPVAFAQVYAFLARLLANGLVEVAGVERVEGPERKSYALTDAGLTQVDRWLSSPEEPAVYLQSALYTKVVVALLAGRDATTVLDVQRAAHLEEMRALTRRKVDGDLAARLVCDHALFHLEADLRWLELAAARGLELTTLGDGRRSALRRTGFGFVFQFGQLVAELTCRENVALPLLLNGTPRRDAELSADRWLERLEVDAVAARLPGEVSGGQGQRVAVARALVGHPAVVFADEPTGALDSLAGERVMGLLTTAAREQGTAVVLVTHEARVAAWSDREMVVRDVRGGWSPAGASIEVEGGGDGSTVAWRVPDAPVVAARADPTGSTETYIASVLVTPAAFDVSRLAQVWTWRPS